jgi:hypothetical protein
LEVGSMVGWIVIGSTLTLISGYWLLFRPIHDSYRERRGKPYLRISCMLFGHNWVVYTEPEDQEVFWCRRCDLVGHGQR